MFRLLSTQQVSGLRFVCGSRLTSSTNAAHFCDLPHLSSSISTAEFSASQIMAGDDSPTEKRDEFHFGRSTPPPTTSYVANKQDFSVDIKTVAEPPKEEKDKDKDKEKDKDDKDDVDFLGPGANPGYNPDEIRRRDEDEPRKRDKRDDNDRDRDKDNPGKKIDGSECLDGQWIPSKDSKQQPEEEEDDNCTVKCLYYTMQCCECSIS